MVSEESNKEQINNIGLKQKWVDLYDKFKFPVTIEPIVFFFTLSVGLNEIIRPNLIIAKVCQNKLNYTADICDDLNNHTEAETEVTKHVTDYEALYSTISVVPKLLYALLAGTWSDTHGRRPLMFLAVLGQLLASLSYGLNFMLLTQISWTWLYLELVNDLCGTYVSYYIAEYSFITDITNESQRTYRLSVVDGMDYVSTSIGTKISAPLFLSIGYFGVFGCSASACVLALLLLVFMVRESLDTGRQESGDTGSNTDTGHEETGESSSVTPLTSSHHSGYGAQEGTQPCEDTAKEESGAKTNFVKSSLMFVVSSVRTVLMPRAGHRRLILLLSVFNFMCYIFTYNGTEGTHRYYYARQKYGWDEQQMSSYLFNYRLAYLASLWLVIPLLSNVAKLSDNTIGIIACLTTAAGFILPAVTPGGAENYIWFIVGSFVCMLAPVNTIVTRTTISRAVSPHEIGRVYSVLALFSAVSGSLVEAGFQKLYSSSLEFLEGGVYLLVMAGLLLVTIPVSFIVRHFLRTI